MRQEVAGLALTPEQAAVADQGTKAMMPLAGGRPLLDYILSSLADAGITEVVIVVGPEHELVRARYQQQLTLTRLTMTLAVQTEAKGTADAVLAAESVVGAEPFLVVNADNLYPVGALRLLRELDGPGLVGYDRDGLIRESNIEEARIARFAVMWTDGGHLSRIIEKPDASVVAQSTVVSMNSWRFSPTIFEACRRIGPSARGEYELQDAVTYALEHLGERFTVIPWTGGVLDLSSRADIATVAARLEGVEVLL